ncbi:MAG: hypothetical protein IAF38_01790 [Bacteroidia bacterium]|nr:hypothetical protein [Bacteroidia bacterium]
MSKGKNEHLFQLIHALEKSEKRYVSLFLQKNSIGEKNNYLRLFNIYSNQKNPDENKIYTKLKKDFSRNKFTVTRHYLYNLILKALRFYHDQDSTERELQNELREISVLFEKKLFAHCLTKTNEGFKRAENNFLFTFLLEFCDWRLRLANVMMDLDYLQNQRERNYQLQWDSIEGLKEQKVLQSKNYENFVLIKTQWIKKGNVLPDKIAELKKMKAGEMKSPQAQLSYYQVLSGYYFTDGNEKQAMACLVKLNEVFEKNVEMQETHFNQYLACLNNLTLLLLDKRDFEKAEKNISVMRQLKVRTEERSARVKERWISAALRSALFRNEMAEQETLMNEIKEFCETKKISTVYRLLFYHELSSWHFFYGNRKTAITYLNKVLNESDKSLRPDIQRSARIMNFVFHYENNNTEYIRFMLKNFKRFRWKKEEEDKAEHFFFGFFTELVNAETKKVKKDIFLNLKKFIEENKKDKYISQFYLDNFDFEKWLKGKN